MRVMKSDEAREAILAGEVFPDGLAVGGHLYLAGCIGLTTLPDRLKVDGGLDLSGCAELPALPNHLTVGLWLHIGSYAIISNRIVMGTSLPETIIASIPGCRLSEVFSHHLLNGRKIMDLMIRSAGGTESGFLVLEFDENTLDYLEVKP